MTKNKSEGFQCLLDMIKQVILNETGKEVIVEIVTDKKSLGSISKTVLVNGKRVARASIDSIRAVDELEVQNHLYWSFVSSLCMQAPPIPEGSLYCIKDIIEGLKK